MREMRATLLVELLAEELPPKPLRKLSQAFRDSLSADLQKGGFLTESSLASAFATPRRLAVSVSEVLAQAPDAAREVTGPPVSANAQAIAGFARKNGLPVEDLQQRDSPKGRIFVARLEVPGASLDHWLAGAVEEALKKLPVPKLMRWGDGEAQFVRPVHRLVMLHGTRVIPGRVLGLEAGNLTSGHRFMSHGAIAIANADAYAETLRQAGRVIADFSLRRTTIETALLAKAQALGASLGEHADLLEEVTALVEHPSVYVGAFDAQFLDVPQECLILTMRQNQKYFPLFDAAGRLLPKFLIISNMQLEDPSHIVGGNQRVVRPRLEDARFFYAQDRKARLESRVPELGRVVYHNKLGSQLLRTERIQLLAGTIARALGADALLAERAAWLAKADLLTGMVGEFPELQGTMGRYYALHDGEPAAVADAIEAHYRPRFAGDSLPEGTVAAALALADKLDTLAGLFGIGQHPSGDKDPFGLRRAGLGVVRLLVEKNLPLSLPDLLDAAFKGHPGKAGDARAGLETFLFDRMRGYFLEQGYSAKEVEAVLCMNPVSINLIPRQLEAVRAFAAMPESASLAAANKRVANILRQAAAKGESFEKAELAELAEPAERALHEAIHCAAALAKAQFERGDYTAYLRSFAVLKTPVDAFFDSVMVMVDDAKVRRARLALLADLRSAMNRVADLSKLDA